MCIRDSLFLGDLVGRPGRIAVQERLPALREAWKLDCVIINGANSAGGFGITEAICDEILAAGADVVTLGNHSWDQREALVFITRQDRLIRPANYPPGTPGRGATVIEARNGARVPVSYTHLDVYKRQPAGLPSPRRYPRHPRR